jgi:hypothetical protein
VTPFHPGTRGVTIEVIPKAASLIQQLSQAVRGILDFRKEKILQHGPANRTPVACREKEKEREHPLGGRRDSVAVSLDDGRPESVQNDHA